MNLTYDGLTLWFGTPDAPGPFEGEVVPRAGVSLVIGVHPANPTNSVSVRYRVDSGFVLSVPGCELRCDYARSIQYFGVRFGRFSYGTLVEYWPMVSCAGRQAPSEQQRRQFSGRFRLQGLPPSSETQGSRRAGGRV